MRVWLTQIEEYDTGNVDGNGDPIMNQRPRGLVGDGAWAQWPVVDEDDTPHPGGWVVALAKDMNVAPTFGRDVGDPQTPAFHLDPLPQAATNLVETNVGMEAGELAGATRAEVIRAITADEGAALGCTWGPQREGARIWTPTTRQVRRFRRRQARAWFNSLLPGQRNFIRSLKPEVQDVILETPPANRIAVATALYGLTDREKDLIASSDRADRKTIFQALGTLTNAQKLELEATDPEWRVALIESWS